jgi:hypothetical protein
MEERKNICLDCEKFLAEVNTCLICACPSSYLWENIEAQCPLKKWVNKEDKV